jgi:hypothetical protein
MRRQEKIQNFIKLAINKQFEIAGHDKTYEDAVAEDKYWDKYTITESQDVEYKEWFVAEFKKQFRTSKRAAENEYSWFSLYLLRTVKDPEPIATT